MDWISNLISNRPFVAVIPSATGVGFTYIPKFSVILNDPVITFLEPYIAYIRVLLIIATFVSAILAIILQCRKLKDKK